MSEQPEKINRPVAPIAPEKQHVSAVNVPAARPVVQTKSALRTVRENLGRTAAVASAAQKLDAMAGNPVTDRMKSYLLECANLPLGKFTYTKELFALVGGNAQNLATEMDTLDTLTGAARTKKLVEIAEKGEMYTEQILQQFIRDNAKKETYDRFTKKRFERVNDVYHTELLTGQLGIMKALVCNQNDEAYKKSISFVRNYFFGLGPQTAGETEGEKSMIADLARRQMSFVQEKLYPVFEKKIAEFAKRGFFRQFASRAWSTAGFMGDWIATPFLKSSRDRMSDTLQPVAYMGIGGAAQKLYPIMRDILSIGWNVSVSKGMALELLASCAGVVAFDAALCVGTYGAGVVLKGVQTAKVAGTVIRSAQVLNGVRMGTSIGRTAVSPARFIGQLSLLDLEKLQEKQKGS